MKCARQEVLALNFSETSQAVRLESAWSDRVRYMVVVYTSGREDTEENILLGIDFTSKDWYENLFLGVHQ